MTKPFKIYYFLRKESVKALLIFFLFAPFFLKYLAKISLNREMTQLHTFSVDSYFNNFRRYFGWFFEYIGFRSCQKLKYEVNN